MLSIYRIDRRIDFNQSQFFSRFWFLQCVSSTTTWNYVKKILFSWKLKKIINFSKITSRWWGFLYSHSCFCGGWATSFFNWDDFFLSNKFNIRIKFGLANLDKLQKILVSKIVQIHIFTQYYDWTQGRKNYEFSNLTISEQFFVLFEHKDLLKFSQIFQHASILICT